MNKQTELSKYEKQARERINSLIAEYCEGNQQRFAELCGVNKGSISQYCNGKNTPSNISAKKIADKFNLNPAWVMGFDVDRENRAQTSSPTITPTEYEYVMKYRNIDIITQSNVKMMIDNAYNLKNLKEEGRLMDSESSGKAKDDNSSVGGIA